MLKSRYVLVILLFLTILSCSRKPGEEKVVDKKEYPDMIQDNYNHFIYKNGRINLNAQIGRALFFNKKRIIECEKFFAEIYNSQGELTTVIHSDKAVIDNNLKLVNFIKNVKIDMKDKKFIMYTDELKLFYKENRMISEEEVLIEKEDGSFLKADSMESDFKEDTTNFVNLDMKYHYDDSTTDKNVERN